MKMPKSWVDSANYSVYVQEAFFWEWAMVLYNSLPDRNTAQALLKEAEGCNPGLWGAPYI